MNVQTTFRAFALLLTASLLAACSGGTGGSGATGGNGQTAVATGVMTKGSVIVNGVHFDDTTASIRIDDTPGKQPADLKDGMLVKVRGLINDDRVTGVAQQVEVENEVRGTVQTTSPTALPPSFTVVNQTVFVDDLTVFANFNPAPVTPSAAVTALTVGTSVVEVYGLRDANANIRASRIEMITIPVAGTDELKGTVAGLSGNMFTLNGVTVDSTGATLTPTGATLANGQPVEVHGSFIGTTFFATRVDREDLEDAQFEHAAGEDFSIEGEISGCTVPCASFTVKDQAVQTNASTRFENGSVTDLANDIRVEAEGHQFNGATLIAEKIQFNRSRVILTGAVTATNGTIPGTGTSITVLGKNVQINSLTEIIANAGITTADRVEVRGYIDTAGNIVAERVDDSPSGGNTDIVQARVTTEAGSVLTLLGIDANLTGATQLLDTNELPISLSAFLAAVTPASGNSPGTLVKVKGTFTAGTPGTIAVDEAELEN
ncbi:MAG: DUF5666 domain-containing protein [Burkholderiales bacterium]